MGDFNERSREALSELSLTSGVHLHGLAEALFVKEVVARSLRHCISTRWNTSGYDVSRIRSVDYLWHQRSEHSSCAVVAWDDAVALLDSGGGSTSVEVATDRADAEELVSFLKEQLGQATDHDREVRVFFWSAGMMGGDDLRRPLVVPSWDEIAHNYPSSTRAAMESLLGRYRRDGSGRLILWHGPPGTGKTWALRALSLEWRDWCELYYILDPESFFGRADYMLDVLSDEMHSGEESNSDKWRLVVLEDAGELLTADAKERVGQGLSRLLNLTDGLVGQGCRIMTLITTNEPVAKLHEAVARAGRCDVEIHFDDFSSIEAAGWFERAGRPELAGTDVRLADMYARLKGVNGRSGIQRIGFTT